MVTFCTKATCYDTRSIRILRFTTSLRQIGQIFHFANYLLQYYNDKIQHFQNFLESAQLGSILFGTDVRSNPVKF